MRHPHPQLTARALRLRQRRTPTRSARAGRAARLLPSLLPRLRSALRSAVWWAPGLAALLVIAIALSGAGTTTAGAASGSQAHAPARPWVGRASPPATLPPIARWQDIKDGTAYTLHVTSNTGGIARLGKLFTFTAPNGDEVEGVRPLITLSDQSLAQATSPDPTVLGGCQTGILLPSAQTSTPNGPAGANGAPPQAEFSLQAHFDQYLLVAYAQILYAPVADKNAVAAVCAGNATAAGVTALTMSAGCTATSCTAPVDDAVAAPPAYEQAMVHAMQERGLDAWSAVWALTSRTVTAQYTQADFAAMMNHLADQVGTITAITPISGGPAVTFDTGGQAYYTIVENITYTHGGTSKTVQVTSYYLLEGGEWMFWFSAPYGS